MFLNIYLSTLKNVCLWMLCPYGLNLGPLQEQHVLLSVELSLQPLKSVFLTHSSSEPLQRASEAAWFRFPAFSLATVVGEERKGQQESRKKSKCTGGEEAKKDVVSRKPDLEDPNLVLSAQGEDRSLNSVLTFSISDPDPEQGPGWWTMCTIL